MEYSAKRFELSTPQCVHLDPGKCYGLLITLQGSAILYSDEDQWRMGSEQLMLSKPHAASRLEYSGGKFPITFWWVRISPALLEKLSTEDTDVRNGFEVTPNRTAVIRPGSKALMMLKNLTAELSTLREKENRYCLDLLEDSILKMFVALVLRACASEDKYSKNPKDAFSLDGVFSYIHAHLTEDLTLEQLEKEFFVSSSYLNKEFKRCTGQTVHRYIVKVRLDLCRRYLEQGYSSAQIYRMVGFGGYNHFFKAFKKEYGITPKQYVKSIGEREEEK